MADFISMVVATRLILGSNASTGSHDQSYRYASSSTDGVGTTFNASGQRVILAAVFEACAERWERETAGFSFLHQKTQHEAYRQLVELGEAAIPFAIARLGRSPFDWATWLVQVTGQDPVPENEMGNAYAIVEAWRAWGKREHAA